jgi:L-ribulose-5-phosphate 3-epimerase
VLAMDSFKIGIRLESLGLPLRRGDIDWKRYMSVLKEVGYRGWLTVECETGDSRLSDVAEGVAFLRRLVG